MKRKDDSLPVAALKGAVPNFPARAPERTVTEDAVLQHETPEHKMIHGDMVDSNRKLINVYRGGVLESVANLFKKGADTLDDVQQGITWRKILSGALDVSGNIDMAGSAWVNKILDNIADGGTYGRPLLARLSSGKPWIDFSEAIHLNKILDYIADSGSYAKTTPNEKTGAGRGYTVIDSGYEVYLNDSGSNATKKVHLGTQSTPAQMQRIYRVPFTAFVPDSSTAYTYDRSNYLRATGSTGINFYAPLVVPQGSTIIGMTARLYKLVSGDSVLADLWRASDNTSMVQLSLATLATNGAWTTVTGSSVSEAVTSSYTYVLRVNAFPASVGNNPGLSWVEVTVTVPDINTGL